MGKLLDLVGNKFGRLVVLRRDQDVSQSRYVYWICKCDCGLVKSIRADSLRNGSIVSCGCQKRDNLIKYITDHGMSRSPEYRTWERMINRCNNPNFRLYSRYGGRGITVCKRWLSFNNFYLDMGPKLGPEYSLDRINNNGNYEPGNVKWSTKLEQTNNTSKNIHITYKGKTLTLAEWARVMGIHDRTLRWRIMIGKWSVERALTTPSKIK